MSYSQTCTHTHTQNIHAESEERIPCHASISAGWERAFLGCCSLPARPSRRVVSHASGLGKCLFPLKLERMPPWLLPVFCVQRQREADQTTLVGRRSVTPGGGRGASTRRQGGRCDGGRRDSTAWLCTPASLCQSVYSCGLACRRQPHLPCNYTSK